MFGNLIIFESFKVIIVNFICDIVDILPNGSNFMKIEIARYFIILHLHDCGAVQDPTAPYSFEILNAVLDEFS